MSDDDRPVPGPPDDESDERDERLAALLAVDPLPELTRRRLVRGALDATSGIGPSPDHEAEGPWLAAGRRRRVWLGAAAAAIVAVTVTALVLRGGSGDQPTAARAPTGAGSATTAPARTPSAAQSTPAAGAGSDTHPATPGPEAKSLAPGAGPGAGDLGDLGDLGEVARPATLRARVEQAQQTLQPGARFASGDTAASTFSANPCAAALAAARPGLGPIQAVGTARLHGKPATVVVATEPSGPTVAIVIADAGCAVGAPVQLTTPASG